MLEKANVSLEDWMFIINRPEVEEKEAVDMLKWFNKHYKSGVSSQQFRTFFPAINTGHYLSDMVFR